MKDSEKAEKRVECHLKTKKNNTSTSTSQQTQCFQCGMVPIHFHNDLVWHVAFARSIFLSAVLGLFSKLHLKNVE